MKSFRQMPSGRLPLVLGFIDLPSIELFQSRSWNANMVSLVIETSGSTLL